MAKKKKSSPMIWIILGIVLVIVLIVVFNRGPKDRSVEVAIEAAQKRSIVETVYASGKLFPVVEVEITSNVSGTIVELLVQEGQTVKEGQLLAKIDPEALVSIVERAEATASSSKAQLENIKAQRQQMMVQLENTKQIYERNKQLFAEGVISKAEYELSDNAYRAAQVNIEAMTKSILSADFSVKSAEATVREQRKNLSQTAIYAPMSGVVSKLNKKKGEQVVGTAQMAGTPILKIANLNSIEVRVDVNERDILNVHVGDTADIELDAYPGRKFYGTVTQIANTANNLSTLQLTSDQVTNFEVHILVAASSYAELQREDGKSPFRAGLSASAEIRTNTLYGILSVPIAAVTAREEEQVKGKAAVKKEEDKKAVKTTELELKEYVFVQQGDSVVLQLVKTGIQNDTYIQITSGLKEGQQVVMAPYDAIAKKLENGAKVKVVPEADLYKTKGKEKK